MNSTLFRRGPDGEGFYSDSKVGLAMRRLSIIDVHNGWQPIFNEDHTVVVVLNGEIYNYRQLRSQLAAQGHHFRTNSDTEVLVHLYEQYGREFPKFLDGMFSFALWDMSKGLFLLCRDRLGIKPLYIGEHDGVLYFASEIKALRAAELDVRAISATAVIRYFELGYVPAPLSIYDNIKKVPPGTLITLQNDTREQVTYWTVPRASRELISSAQTVTDVETALLSAVESHLVSDVPVGAFLSGGIDSGLITAMASQITGPGMPTFTVGFEKPGKAIVDERPIAVEISKQYRTEHFEINVMPDVEGILGEIVDAFDEPFADDSVVPTYYVSAFAASKVKVCLSGLGGDELFAGYRRHAGISFARNHRLILQLLKPALSGPLSFLPERWARSDAIDHLKRFIWARGTIAEQYFSYLSALEHASFARVFSHSFMNAARPTSSSQDLFTLNFDKWQTDDTLARALHTDLMTYLPDDVLALSDRLSMWHSLEVRVPFLDTKLVELSRRVPTRDKINAGKQKVVLRKIAERWLPKSVVSHRKQGFEAPMGSWLRGPLLPLFDSLVNKQSVERIGIQSWEAIEDARNEHVTGKSKRSKFLFSTLMLTAWAGKQGDLRVVP